MTFTLQVWRQKSSKEQGEFKTYQANNVRPDMSFLEMLDEVNEVLILEGEEPIACDHDCREGICGMCSAMINGGHMDRIVGRWFVNSTCALLRMRPPL